MPNPRFLQTAERWMNKEVPVDAPKKPKARNPKQSETGLSFPDNVSDISIFSYDGKHKEFYQELLAKSNELFRGTKAEMPNGQNGQVEGMYSLKRFGLITAIYSNPQLRSHNLWPITPIQSEHLLKAGVLTNNEDYWEDLGLVLYDTSEDGYNPNEAKALRESLKKHRQDLGLSASDLEQRLVIVSPGLEVDSSMPHGVKPIVLPGVTQAYAHEVLEKVGEDPNFEGYGLKGGLPLIKQLDNGDRTLYMPDETEDIGVRVLVRGRYSDLYARGRGLVDSYADGRVNFAPQARASKPKNAKHSGTRKSGGLS